MSVNIDHIATLRKARGGQDPDPVWGATLVELSAADGITVHLREDRRHIEDRDVHLLKQIIRSPFNLEMAANPEIIDIALKVAPELITLVPERRAEVTTEGGLNVASDLERLSAVVAKFTAAEIPVSFFIDADPSQIAASAQAGVKFVEIHTGPYAAATSPAAEQQELSKIEHATQKALKLGLEVNAGHGLNVRNVRNIAQITGITGLYIGHSIISRAVFIGLNAAILEIREQLTGL